MGIADNLGNVPSYPAKENLCVVIFELVVNGPRLFEQTSDAGRRCMRDTICMGNPIDSVGAISVVGPVGPVGSIRLGLVLLLSKKFDEANSEVSSATKMLLATVQ